MVTMSSREFNQETSRAKKAAARGPVVITDRGQATHVLLTIADYRRLVGDRPNIVDLLGMPEYVEFEAPRLSGPISRPTDLC